MSLRAILSIAFALAGASLQGQRSNGYLGGGGGLLAPAGSFGDVDGPGWHLLLSTVGTLKGRLGYTADALFGQTAHQNGVSGKSTLSGGAANVALFLAGQSRSLRPFVLAGIGGFRVNVDVPGFGATAATKLALEYGGGLLLGSGRRRGFLVARYLTVRTSPKTTTFIPISGGIMFPIGIP